MFKFLKKLGGALFGSSSGDKGLVTEVSDAVDKWIPSAATKHKQSIEDLKAGDESQDSARQMQLPRTDSVIGIVVIFNAIVDGANRLVRPGLTLWMFGILAGWWAMPPILLSPAVPPMFWNIAWTIITFWFGSRVLFKDIPSIWKYLKK